MSSLIVKSLSIRYKTTVTDNFQIKTIDHHVLQNISFEANHEKNIFITGKTGTGKTSLLKSVAGFIPDSSGEIFVNNQLLPNNLSNQRSVLIQYVPQSNQESFNQAVSMESSLINSVRNHVFQSVEPIKNDIHNFTRLFDLSSELLSNKPSKLSGGQLQRFGIIRALLGRPQVLLLDEPTSALHDELKFSVMEKTAAFAKLNKITLCVVNHDTKIIHQFADQILRISAD